MSRGRFRLVAVITLLAALVYWLLIFLATHVSVPPSTTVRVSDKLQHAGAYFILALLLIAAGRTWGLPRGRVYWGVILIGAIYGATDELTQMLVPNRSADVWDWVADMAGILLGCLAAVIVERGWKFFVRGSKSKVQSSKFKN